MENYRKNKLRIVKNNLGSLYIKEKRDCYHPVIYIGGQMEHRCHVLERLTGCTFDPGHNMFDGSWFYDYPLSGNKGDYNAANFANNLLACITELKLENVTLITESAGGLVGAYATLSPRIKKVIAIHPPIIGSPLANPIALERKKLEFSKQMLINLTNIIVNTDYGFQKDNLQGLNLKKVNLNKLLVVSSCLNSKEEKNKLALLCHDLILQLTGLQSDGIVVYEPQVLANLGIDYLPNEPQLNHFAAGSKEYIEEVYRKTLKKDIFN